MFASRTGPRPATVPPALIERTRPVSTSATRLLPVHDVLAPLLPDGGLRRGSAVTLAGDGASALSLALVAGPTRAGCWCAAVGWPDLGVEAAHGLGVDLSRLVLVPQPGPQWPQVVATLLSGLDAVLFRPAGAVRPVAARRLLARAREQQTALVVKAGGAAWPEGADLCLQVTVDTTAEAAGWEGLERGAGYLRRRRVVVTTTGRRSATRPVTRRLWLPSATGTVEAA